MNICSTDSRPGIAGFKQRLKSIRVQRGLTQEQLSIKCKMKPCHVSHFETGQRMPNIKNLRLLCQKLNVSADYLLGLQGLRSHENP